MRSRISRISVAFIAALALPLALAGPSSAAAPSVYERQGQTTFGGQICIVGHCVPDGWLVMGSRSYDTGNHTIFEIRGRFLSVLSVCGWWMDANILDVVGHQVWHGQGTANNCTRASSMISYNLPLPTFFRGGNACMTIWRSASGRVALVGSACVPIDQ